MDVGGRATQDAKAEAGIYLPVELMDHGLRRDDANREMRVSVQALSS